MESILQTMAIVGTIAAATWTLRSKLSDVEVALKSTDASLSQHIKETKGEFKNVIARIIQLEERRKKAAKRT